MTVSTDVQIRWLIRRDMPEVLQIEREAYPPSQQWTDADFLECLRQRNCIGMVVSRQDRIVGFMIYELERHRLDVLNMAVAVDSMRTGVGRQMVGRMIEKLSQQKRTTITVKTRESNLGAHLFLRACGFRCTGVSRGEFEDTGEDAYAFRFQMRKED